MPSLGDQLLSLHISIISRVLELNASSPRWQICRWKSIDVRVLGLVARTHDSGLALIHDGFPLLILEEERFNREKHTRRFPFRSLAAAFPSSDLGDIDVITVPWQMQALRRSMYRALTADLPASLNLLAPSARPTQSSLILNLPMGLRWGLLWQFGPRKLPPIVQVRHHDAHAALFFASPFEDAAVLVMDGYGDETGQSTYVGEGKCLRRLAQGAFFDSLGMLYTAVCQHLGFKQFEEGTVMALAASGCPTYLGRFKELIHFGGEGEFCIDRSFISYNTHGLKRPFTQRFIETFGPPRQPGEPLTDRHRDLAFALQATIEDTILQVVRDLAKRHPSRNLCLMGGVALNCVANQRLLEDSDYKSIWIPPCASDSGAPFGSALWHYHQTLGHGRRFALNHAFYGREYSDADMEAALNNAGLNYQCLPDDELYHRTAKDIAAGKIVGWFQGRSEIGPRALGHRSILADPRKPAMKDRLNLEIKRREPFRPFAPAVLEERAEEFFESVATDPYMTLAPKMRAHKRWDIPAAAHVDGTARIQTVARATNPRFYQLIKTFAALTGVPVLLNTSFNLREPIVENPGDAVSCFRRASLDVLVLGNYYAISTAASQTLTSSLSAAAE